MKKTQSKAKLKLSAFQLHERARRKSAFIRALAVLLTKDQAKWSIKLSMGSEDAQRWVALRGMTPLVGYIPLTEAIKLLTEFLD
jgi:hypothetical protein